MMVVVLVMVMVVVMVVVMVIVGVAQLLHASGQTNYVNLWAAELPKFSHVK